MDEINALTTIDFRVFLTNVVIIMAAFVAGVKLVEAISCIIGKPCHWVKKRNEDHENLIKAIADINRLAEKEDLDMKQSTEQDIHLEQSINSINNKVDDMATVLKYMKETQDNDKLAEYKDKISQSYRYYKARKYSNNEPYPYWNIMEKESLMGLIRAYESHGGENSFVHSIVEPECLTWKIVDKDME